MKNPMTWRTVGRGLLWLLGTVLLMVLFGGVALWWVGSGQGGTLSAIDQGLYERRHLLWLGNVAGVMLIAGVWRPLVTYFKQRALRKVRTSVSRTQAIEAFAQGLMALRLPVLSCVAALAVLSSLRLWA